jgi:hypothetical protein
MKLSHAHPKHKPWAVTNTSSLDDRRAEPVKLPLLVWIRIYVTTAYCVRS